MDANQLKYLINYRDELKRELLELEKGVIQSQDVYEKLNAKLVALNGTKQWIDDKDAVKVFHDVYEIDYLNKRLMEVERNIKKEKREVETKKLFHKDIIRYIDKVLESNNIEV